MMCCFGKTGLGEERVTLVGARRTCNKQCATVLYNLQFDDHLSRFACRVVNITPNDLK